MGLSVRDFNDYESLVREIAEPLEAIAGNLAEIRDSLEHLIANGGTIQLSIKIGDGDE